MILISAIYPNHAGSRFDADYYMTRHSQLANQLLTPYGLQQVRIVLGVSDLQGAAPAFWAISEMHFVSRDHFERAMHECGPALFEDAKNYTDVTPTLQVGVVTTVQLA